MKDLAKELSPNVGMKKIWPTRSCEKSLSSRWR